MGSLLASALGAWASVVHLPSAGAGAAGAADGPAWVALRRWAAAGFRPGGAEDGAWERAVSAETARFSVEAVRRRGEALRTPRALGLATALAGAALGLLRAHGIGTPGAGRANAARCVELVAAALDVCRAAGPFARSPPNPTGKDGAPPPLAAWLAHQMWLGTVFSCVLVKTFVAIGMAKAGMDPPDPVAGFADAPAPFPPHLLQRIPPPRPGDTVPAELLALAPDFTLGDLFGWQDPFAAPRSPNATSARERVVAYACARIKETSSFYMGVIGFALRYRQAAFANWLRANAGISPVELLVVEDVFSKGAVRSGRPLLPSWANRLESRFVSLVRDPAVREAVRRRAFFREAQDRMRNGLPLDVREALVSGDLALVREALPDFRSPDDMHALLSFVMVLQHAGLLAESPQPYSEATALMDVGPPSEMHTIWWETRAFYEASRRAASLARFARLLLALGKGLNARSYYTPMACDAALQAAAASLRVLRRLDHLEGLAAGDSASLSAGGSGDISEGGPSLGAGGSGDLVSEGGRSRTASDAATGAEADAAALLKETIRADIDSCLALLEASGLHRYLAARTKIRDAVERPPSDAPSPTLWDDSFAGPYRPLPAAPEFRSSVGRGPNLLAGRRGSNPIDVPAGRKDRSLPNPPRTVDPAELIRISSSLPPFFRTPRDDNDPAPAPRPALPRSRSDGFDAPGPPPVRPRSALAHGPASASDTSSSDTSTDSSSASELPAPGTKVRFGGVRIGTTYSREEYPARSAAAPDSPDGKAGPGFLSVLIGQRGDLPDLKKHWR
ncbi:hypothetical protein DFJ74DRAFT_679816 [Hyaloraphidium curvatum]|nr:hypothetical protein DFJ74DRAFT_679816 [Hyaloraphidium curvatum]